MMPVTCSLRPRHGAMPCFCGAVAIFAIWAVALAGAPPSGPAIARDAEPFEPIARVSPASRGTGVPTLRGSVVFADGRPAPGALIRYARLQTDDATGLRYGGSRTDTDGHWEMRLPPGAYPARFAVSVAPGYRDPATGSPVFAAPQIVSSWGGRGTVPRFVLASPAYVQGQVRTRSGRPVGGVRVQVPDVSFARGVTTHHCLTYTISGPDGRFLLAAPAGAIQVEVTRCRPTRYQAEAQTVTLAPGETANLTLHVSPVAPPSP